MPSCCFCGRGQGAKGKNEGYTFHKFPREGPTLAVWMEFAEECSAKVKPRSVVCSGHFTADCFDRFLRSVHLKRLAVPTIMIQRVKSAKTSYPEILMPLDQYKQSSNLSTEQFVKVRDARSNMEGVEEINFDNVDSNISTKDDYCSIDTFAIKKTDKMVHFDENQWEKTRADEKNKLKYSAISTLFNHTPIKSVQKSPKKILKYSTVSLVKRAISENEHSYSKEPQETNYLSHQVDASPKGTENTLVDTDVDFDASSEKLQLIKQIENLKKKLLHQARLIQKLRQKNSLNVKAMYKQRKKQATFTNNLKSFLNDNQISSLGVKNRRGFKWSNTTINKALHLKFACGFKGYHELLAQKHPLPSLRTIRRKLQNMSFQSGILTDVLEMLSIKISSFNDMEKECVLFLYDMVITEEILYEVTSKSFIGNVTLPDQKGIANHCLVFMLGGISSPWKQTVAYYFTSNSVKGHVLKPIINSIISKAESINLRVNSITSDLGTSNIAMWTSYNVHCSFDGNINNSAPHPCDSERRLYFVPDVPHLFKNIKQTLLNNKVILIPQDIMEKNNLTSRIVDCKHIEALCKHQDDRELKLFCKLDLKDFTKPNRFDKIKVSKSTNVINIDANMRINAIFENLVENEGYHQSCETTFWFIKQVVKWFTLMTIQNPKNALSKSNEGKYFEKIQFLKEFMYLFKNIKIGYDGMWEPCQTGVLLATQSIVDLQDMFLNKKNFRFLLTSRFTQGSFENLFSNISSIQIIPNALQFKNNLKIICVAQYLKTISNSAYDQNDQEFLRDLFLLSNSSETVSKVTSETAGSMFPCNDVTGM